jgi:hypothetical protein
MTLLFRIPLTFTEDLMTLLLLKSTLKKTEVIVSSSPKLTLEKIEVIVSATPKSTLEKTEVIVSKSPKSTLLLFRFSLTFT